MAGIPQIDRKEIDKLASEWCKAKHVVVMLDDVAKQFACDCSNIVLKNYLESVLERVAAKKAAAGAPAPAPVKKSSLVLTDM
jgi:hypothetical protein